MKKPIRYAAITLSLLPAFVIAQVLFTDKTSFNESVNDLMECTTAHMLIAQGRTQANTDERRTSEQTANRLAMFIRSLRIEVGIRGLGDTPDSRKAAQVVIDRKMTEEIEALAGRYAWLARSDPSSFYESMQTKKQQCRVYDNHAQKATRDSNYVKRIVAASEL